MFILTSQLPCLSPAHSENKTSAAIGSPRRAVFTLESSTGRPCCQRMKTVPGWLVTNRSAVSFFSASRPASRSTVVDMSIGPYLFAGTRVRLPLKTTVTPPALAVTRRPRRARVCVGKKQGPGPP